MIRTAVDIYTRACWPACSAVGPDAKASVPAHLASGVNTLVVVGTHPSGVLHIPSAGVSAVIPAAVAISIMPEVSV